jgi:hypothetical protein
VAPRVQALACSFNADQLNTLIIQKCCESADRIAATANACDDALRQRPRSLKHLSPGFV